jgi:hypothetical protein
MQSFLNDGKCQSIQRFIHAHNDFTPLRGFIKAPDNLPDPTTKLIPLHRLAETLGGYNPKTKIRLACGAIIDRQAVFEQTTPLCENPLKISG